MPLITRRSSTRGLPVLPRGRWGSTAAQNVRALKNGGEAGILAHGADNRTTAFEGVRGPSRPVYGLSLFHGSQAEIRAGGLPAS